MHPRARHLVDSLGLQPHPEGGHYREVVRDEARVRHPTKEAWRSALTHIHFLLEAGAFSALHRVAQVEVWHHVEGGPLELTLVHEAEGTPPRVETVVLGREPGQRLLHAVPALAWQAARPLDAYTLCGCSVAPGFEFEDFELPPREALLARFPTLHPLVTALTSA